jgi:Tol biopolymer transport system component
VYDLARGNTTRIAHDGSGLVRRLVWTPDGRNLVYRASRNSAIWWVRSDGSAQPQLLYQAPDGLDTRPGSFTPDGRNLAFVQSDAAGHTDLWILPMGNDPSGPKPGTPRLFLQNSENVSDPAFSPDGRWLAYASNASGDNQVFVRPFTDEASGAGQVHISTSTGVEPRWSGATKELFYLADGRVMVVPYTVNGREFQPGKPRQWVNLLASRMANAGSYDVEPDGKRLVGTFNPEKDPAEANGNLHLVFLLNFFDHLKTQQER